MRNDALYLFALCEGNSELLDMNRRQKVDAFVQQKIHDSIKQEDEYDELVMLGEYIDDIAEHPVYTPFFRGYLQNKGYCFDCKHTTTYSEMKVIWEAMSTKEQICVYRSYIDNMTDIKHPEAIEWYDDYMNNCYTTF